MARSAGVVLIKEISFLNQPPAAHLLMVHPAELRRELSGSDFMHSYTLKKGKKNS